jgi:hypothetical protein
LQAFLAQEGLLASVGKNEMLRVYQEPIGPMHGTQITSYDAIWHSRDNDVMLLFDASVDEILTVNLA